jgi:L-ascorbate metabolism protein UlaG (beta-lactamase superfamily)
MMTLFLLLLGIPLVFVFVGFLLSGPVYRGPVTDHFDGKRFINPGGVKAKGLGEVLQWMVQRKRGPWIALHDLPAGDKPLENNKNGIRITFVNHSTFLIQTRGLNILTDPVWSMRTSPFTSLGPKRMRPPGIRFEDLPRIDMILLSHNHYDHLDMMTLKKLWQRDQPKVVTALGVSAFLKKNNIESAIDLDWWESTTVFDLPVTAVPAQHFSSRGMFDRDGTLWCGFMLKLEGGYFYFVGDTGYNDNTFKEIGNRFSPIQLALVPIGAFKPKWFMSPIHCSPAQAVQIHLDVKARASVATHFGTFPLADDGQAEPVVELDKALLEQGLTRNDFMVLKEGVAHHL